MDERTRNRHALKSFLETQRHPGAAGRDAALNIFFAPGATINVVHPFNEMEGAADYRERFLKTLAEAFDGLFRRDYIAMAGAFEGKEWVSASGHYCGHFAKPWLGIQPTHALAYLRVGEFHRMEDGKAVESYVYLDIPELMIAAGQWPITASPGHDRGYTGFLPGPATQDGLQFSPQDKTESEKSFRIVTDMLARLNTPDEGWRPYWHDNMVWYGPAAFGSFLGVDRFGSFQVPFENAFEGWSGGSANNGMTRHFTRHGDGNYTCSGGWPSLTGIQTGPFLDQPASNKRVFMRVCDWWRREDDLLVENWVFVDIPHVLAQLGCDVFAQARPER